MRQIPRPADTFIKRLNSAILACQKLKKTTDDKNIRMMKAKTGGYYTSAENDRLQPLNMVNRAVAIWLPFLVSGNPKCIVEPIVNLQLKPFAYTFQLALNEWIQKMNFDATVMEPAVLASFFSQGIVKSGTAKAEDVLLGGETLPTGTPFVELVENTNYIFDITARDRSQYEFEGDRYILPTDAAKEMFPKYADAIKQDFKLFGDADSKTIENPGKVEYNELREYTEFIDIYLPKEKVIITILPPHRSYTKIIRTMPYKGPDDGPYDVLAYDYTNGSTIPVPPIYPLMELDTVINTIYTKAREGAERLKKVGVYEGGSDVDAKTAMNAKYGDMIGMSNAAAIKELTLGGVVPELWDFLSFSLNQFSEQGGTVGLDYKARAKTLGQEQMMMSNATRKLDYMSKKVHAFASNIMRKLAFEMWRNPTLQIEAVMKVAGIGEASVVYNQLQQEGNFPDYRFDIELYSMQRLEPEQRYQKMMQLLTSWVLPTAQLAAQQGKPLNIPEITKVLSLYTDVDSESWFLSDPGPMAAGGGGMNSYQPMSNKPGGSDQRFGASEADNQSNLLQQQASEQGAPTGA
jgi:hypothetical protein